MRRSAQRFAVYLLLFQSIVAPLASAEVIERKGRYIWNVGDRGKLNATFDATDEPNRWNVTMKFKFHGQRYTYRGVALGDPKEGALTATVTSEKGIEYRFEGVTEQGIFNGTHYQGKRETGSLTLR